MDRNCFLQACRGSVVWHRRGGVWEKSHQLGDGAAGAAAVRAAGGVSLVQDPGDALVSSMPIRAIEKDHPNSLVRTDALLEALIHCVTPLELERTAAGDKTSSVDR